MMACKLLKRWWPGTELNRRRQPFQGCSLPKLTVCNPYLYLPFPAHFGPTYWTHNGPNSWTHTRMPEFASRTPRLRRQLVPLMPPLRGHCDPQRPLPHEHQQPLAPRDPGINQFPLQ
jgi:hypothetical protein